VALSVGVTSRNSEEERHHADKRAAHPDGSERINEVRAPTAQIVNKEILPNEKLLSARHTNPRLSPSDIDQARGMREHIKSAVKRAGVGRPTCRSSTAARGSTSSSWRT